MVQADVPSIKWSGSDRHLDYVSKAIARVDIGEVVYLIAFADDSAVGHCGIDFAPTADAGRLWALTIHPDYRSQGIGSALIAECETRIAQRRPFAELYVETKNVRARQLYERLDYVETGAATDEWEEEAPDGTLSLYKAECVVMRKELSEKLSN